MSFTPTRSSADEDSIFLVDHLDTLARLSAVLGRLKADLQRVVPGVED